MAPRETPQKTSSKIQRPILKNTKAKASPVSTIKKTILSRKMTEKTPLKVNNVTNVIESRQRTKTNQISTPKPKENSSTQLQGTVTKSAKKATWKRRPKPAHSGVPVPEKMKKLLEKQLQSSDCSF